MEQHQHADALPDSAQRVANLLSELKHDKPVVMLPSAGRTSAEAAAGLGCSVAEIAKSIIFRRLSDDAPVLVIGSGGTSACRLQSDGAAIAGDDRCAGDRCRLGPRRSG